MTELVSKGVQAKFASYVDDLGAMLAATAENKMFTLDGGGGTSIFGQGQPYFWGTRAITPNDPMPGLFQWWKETYPDKKTVGLVGWDIGEPNNGIISEDILAKIAAAGLEFNDLYELVPVGGQDFSQVLPKIKANEPDLLMVSIYGQDPGSFADQAATAGLTAVRIGFEFTPDGVNASKGTYDSNGYTFAYDYFNPKEPASPLAKLFVAGLRRRVRRGSGLLRRQLLRERLRHVGADASHLGRPTRRPRSPATPSTPRCARTSRSSASTAATRRPSGRTRSTRRPTRSIKREMGIFEYKGGEVTPKAFFGIDGADYRTA